MAMLDDDMGFDKASGIFFFKGPHFLKVQQESPGREYIISNGDRIWWYLPDEKTAYRYDDMGKELSILSMIFMGLKKLSAIRYLLLKMLPRPLELVFPFRKAMMCAGSGLEVLVLPVVFLFSPAKT